MCCGVGYFLLVPKAKEEITAPRQGTCNSRAMGCTKKTPEVHRMETVPWIWQDTEIRAKLFTVRAVRCWSSCPERL